LEGISGEAADNVSIIYYKLESVAGTTIKQIENRWTDIRKIEG